MKWLFLVHQVQTPNSKERVKIWRLTKKVGAILYRNSVYVLPYSPENMEDFQWLCQQINDSKGEASVFITETNSSKEDLTIRSIFNAQRENDYKLISESASKLSKRIKTLLRNNSFTNQSIRTFKKEFEQIHDEFDHISNIDFFKTKGRFNANKLLIEAKKLLSVISNDDFITLNINHHKIDEFQNKTWATRENIHIDRLCSSWLIRRFIDKNAKFVFSAESKLPKEAIHFDVLGAEFGHKGENCTFETLLTVFKIKDKALEEIAEIVHDIDLKDKKFSRSEADGINLIVRSLSSTFKDDHKTIEIGFPILDSIYESLKNHKVPKSNIY